MPLPHFIYRIVNVKHEGLFIYYLQEENGKYYFITKHPSSFFGYNEDDLQRKLKLYEEALKLPVISFEDIKEYNIENIDPIVYQPLKENPF
jgi:hypothetical protein